MKLLHVQDAQPFPCILGIDFGTTHSVLAWCQGGKAEIITSPAFPNGLIPSEVWITPEGCVKCAPKSLEDGIPLKMAVVRHLKRLMITHAKPPESFAYPVSLGPSGLWQLEVQGHPVDTLDMLRTFLTYLYDQATELRGRKADHVVMTVPAYFSERSRSALREAAFKAGLPLLRLINEPTAAGLVHPLEHAKTFGVYDMGGGTFDFSVLRGSGDLTEVLAVGGDTHLGGADMDLKIARYIDKDFDFSPPAHKKQVMQAAQHLKELLSSSEEVSYALPFLPESSLKRSTLNHLIEPLIQRSIEVCQKVLRNLEQDHGFVLESLVCIGGISKIPRIPLALHEALGIVPYCSERPEHSVALGAAAYGCTLTDPASSSLLLDITPFSLGLEVWGGVEFFMPRYTPLPFSVSKVFTTAQANQEILEIHVLQGERACVESCTSLVRLDIPLPPLPAHVLRLTITFTLDVEGILHIEAKEDEWGLYKRVSLQPGK